MGAVTKEIGLETNGGVLVPKSGKTETNIAVGGLMTKEVDTGNTRGRTKTSTMADGLMANVKDVASCFKVVPSTSKLSQPAHMGKLSFWKEMGASMMVIGLKTKSKVKGHSS
jgi:hypothetical protein